MKSSHLFKQLNGNWLFKRTIQSDLPDMLSGTVKGSAMFKCTSPDEYHYLETGIFTNLKQQEFSIERAYVYRFAREKARISVYFVDHDATDRLFYHLTCSKCAEEIIATGQHLCGRDMYHARYVFKLDEPTPNFTLTYHVKGPQKAYTAKTYFRC